MRGLVWCCCAWLSFACLADDQPPLVMLANVYDAGADINLADYWVSEKLDGVRGYWDGDKLLTRSGNTIRTPAWFTANWFGVTGERGCQTQIEHDQIDHLTAENLEHLLSGRHGCDSEVIQSQILRHELPDCLIVVYDQNVRRSHTGGNRTHVATSESFRNTTTRHVAAQIAPPSCVVALQRLREAATSSSEPLEGPRPGSFT